MHITFVHVKVKPEHRQQFIEASLDNARNSIQEPGAVRFDLLQQADDPDSFVLLEVYRDEAAAAAHKQTAHYARWRDTVAPWMAQPRQGVRYQAIFPAEPEKWATPK
jgi:autoinducer 2-degrading protein